MSFSAKFAIAMEKIPFKGDPPIASTAKGGYEIRRSTHTDVAGLYTGTGGPWGPLRTL